MEFTYEMLYDAWKDVVTMTSTEQNRVLFRYYLEEQLYKLMIELNNGSFQPSPLRLKTILYPKKRVAQVPALRDKIVQIAMYRNGLYDDLTKPLIESTSACLVNRGDDYASDILKKMMVKYKNKYGTNFYCLKCDIKNYFASIPHDRLFELIERYVMDENFKSIIIKFVNMSNDGLCLGLTQSQALANIYLSELDHNMKEKLKAEFYGRHMDDFYIISYDLDYLNNCWKYIDEYVQSIGLILNPKTCIYHNKIEFLGFKYFFNENGKIIKRLLPNKRRSKRRELKMKLKKVASGEINAEKFIESYNGWRVHALRGNCCSLVSEWDKWIITEMKKLGYKVSFNKRRFKCQKI